MSVNIKRINSPLQIHMQPNLWSEDQRMIHDQNMRMPRDPDGMPLLTAFPLTQDQIQRIDTFGHSGHTVHFPPPHHSQHSPYLDFMQVVDLPLSTREKMSLEPSVPSKRYSSFSQDNLREPSRPRLENTGLDTSDTGRETLRDKLKASIQHKRESLNRVLIPNYHEPYIEVSEKDKRDQEPSKRYSSFFENSLMETSRPRLENTGLDTSDAEKEILQNKLKASVQRRQESLNHVVIPNSYEPYTRISEEYISQIPSFQREQFFEDNYAYKVRDKLKQLAASMKSPQNTIPEKILKYEISNNHYSWLTEIILPKDVFGDIPPQNILEFLSQYSLFLKPKQIHLLYDMLLLKIRTKADGIEDRDKKRVFRMRERNRLRILWKIVFNIETGH